MSNELRPRFLTGLTLYAVLTRGSDAKVWTGSVWELPITADWSTYAVTMTEQGTTGFYYGSMPASQGAGVYDADYFLRVGGSPAVTDPVMGGQRLDWGGTADVSIGATPPVNAAQIGGTGQTGLDIGGNWTAARAAHLDADISSRMATYTQPTGFLAEDFSELDADIEAIQAGVAAIPTTPLLAANVPANFAALGITAGGKISEVVLTDTATTLTNLPAIPANWLTAAGINAGALNGKGDWLLASSYTAPDNADVVTILADAVTLLSRIGAAVALNSDMQTALTDLNILLSRVTAAVALAGSAPSWYAAPVDVSANVTAIKAKTDLLTFTVALHVDATASVGNVTVGGYAAGQDPATLVLDVAASAHNTAGTIGRDINISGSAADPLANPVPASYASGTAGYVIGNGFTGVLAAVGALTGKPITYTGPINPATGAASLVRGDDYLSADGRALVFGLSTTGGNPDLTGATVTAGFYSQASPAPVLTVGCTVTSPGTTSQGVTLQLPAATTAQLLTSAYVMAFVAVLADGHVQTLTRVALTVSAPRG